MEAELKEYHLQVCREGLSLVYFLWLITYHSWSPWKLL